MVYPRFRIISAEMQVPDADEQPVSIDNLRNQMRRRLMIGNPNDFPISNMLLRVQFPEPILRVSFPDHTDAKKMTAFPDWGRTPIKVLTNVADASKSLTVEHFGTNEATGLWRIAIENIPAKHTNRVDFVTTSGTDGGLFGKVVVDSQIVRSDHGPAWYISGEFRYWRTGKSNFVSMLVFDAKSRSVTPSPTVSEINPVVLIRQCRGFRVPGLFHTAGYVQIWGWSKGHSNTEFSFVPDIESTNLVNSVGSMCSREPNIAPSIWVNLKSGAVFRFGNPEHTSN